jgi:hypothetical protein
MTFRAAFYKGQGNAFNRGIHWWDGGPHSHCELVFSNGSAVGASWKDKRQVREKRIDFNPEHWDFLVLPPHREDFARQFADATMGAPYDLLGQLRFFYAPARGAKEGYWCSEWIAAALGSRQAWRYGPNGLYDALLLGQEFSLHSPERRAA